MLEKRLEVSAEGKKVYDIVIEKNFLLLIFRNESYVLLQNEGWLPII